MMISVWNMPNAEKTACKRNNGLVETKYITFLLEGKISGKQNQSWSVLSLISHNNLRSFGVMAIPLNGEERLRILYETFNPDSTVKFQFDYGSTIKNGKLNIKIIYRTYQFCV